jgi:hypothetical protein
MDISEILNFPIYENLALIHGLLATLALFAYGTIWTLIYFLGKTPGNTGHKGLTVLLGLQTFVVGAVSSLGIVVYIAYRTAGGAREFLLNSENTAWLHKISFEYKEYMCSLTPWLLIMAAFFVAWRLKNRLFENKTAVTFIVISSVISAVYLLISMALAVLVTKAAPLQNFDVGSDLFNKGGTIVILSSLVTAAVLFFTFWFVSRSGRPGMEKDAGKFYPIILGSAAGLTALWIINIIQESSESFAETITLISGVGPYSGVVFWSLITVLAVTVIVKLIIFRRQTTSFSVVNWVLLISVILQMLLLFPPVYGIFLPE